jgi:isoleucyl-tRNA synthetase
LARQDKIIGKSLEADIHFHAKEEAFDLLKRHECELKELLNVSKVLVLDALIEPGFRAPTTQGQIVKTMKASDLHSIAVYVASGSKCARCWNFMPEVSNYGVWQNVCTRCQDALKEMKIAPPQVPIDESKESQ